MNDLLLRTLLSTLPPEISTQLAYMKEALEKTGAAEGVFPVPTVGKCKVVITKLED